MSLRYLKATDEWELLPLTLPEDDNYRYFSMVTISDLCEFTCGGNFYNQSGTLTSPLYPDPHPTADCVYHITQPNGTVVNISFITMDIGCDGTPSDYIEMRDGDSEESPLMGRLCGNRRNVLATTQNHLRIR